MHSQRCKMLIVLNFIWKYLKSWILSRKQTARCIYFLLILCNYIINNNKSFWFWSNYWARKTCFGRKKKGSWLFPSDCIKISGPGCLHMIDERLKGLWRLKAHLPSCWGPIPRPCAGGAGLPPRRWEDRCRLTIISNSWGWNFRDTAAEKQVILFNQTTF